ncbi:hypothetical protein BN14_00571 [Rhizoctonia solani AG-1 IB]|uniref:Uncharacterized protein n=1 Tax=Thanatephorus cucumeris (strain AG1-IB / isolate 7/3/14) TaxID=1108050 RepID=M5BKC4_THACB|nr:hypothetical protein BN14_00571 [Rhizoctonia solani AG-1 IB]
MLFTRIALVAFAMSSPTCMTLASGTGANIGFEDRGEQGVVATFNGANSRLEQLMSKSSAQIVTNLDEAKQLISGCKEISVSVAAGMNTFNMGSESNLIDTDGNKMNLEELGEKYSAYQKAESGGLLHISSTHEDMKRIYPQIDSISTIVDTNKYTQAKATELIDSMLGPVDPQ